MKPDLENVRVGDIVEVVYPSGSQLIAKVHGKSSARAWITLELGDTSQVCLDTDTEVESLTILKKALKPGWYKLTGELASESSRLYYDGSEWHHINPKGTSNSLEPVRSDQLFLPLEIRGGRYEPA